MALSVHPDAVAHFNKKGEDILGMLSVANRPRRERSFPSERFVDRTFNANDFIGETKHVESDFKGDEVSRYFEHDGKLVGLSGTNYVTFEDICRAIHKSQSLREVISLRAVKDQVFEWVKSRYKAQSNQALLEFTLAHLESLIKDIQIWVPLFQTEIESSFSVGRVLFWPISKALFDKWAIELLKSKPGNEADQLKKFFDQERRQLQGIAAGTMNFKAEPDRASELAVVEVERMLNLVRFFEPANFEPNISSCCTILGKQHLQRTKLYRVENDILVESIEAIVENGSPHWRIDNRLIAEMKQGGLDKLNTFLTSDKQSEFQLLIVDTLQMYSRCGLAKTYSDKLVYLLVTLESLLLRDPSESIQQNVGERLAFALEKEPDRRKRVVRNFKDVYGMRSDFVHHGNNVEVAQVNTLKEFMMNSWLFLKLVIDNSNNFQTKSQMIDAIENIKFS